MIERLLLWLRLITHQPHFDRQYQREGRRRRRCQVCGIEQTLVEDQWIGEHPVHPAFAIIRWLLFVPIALMLALLLTLLYDFIFGLLLLRDNRLVVAIVMGGSGALPVAAAAKIAPSTNKLIPAIIFSAVHIFCILAIIESFGPGEDRLKYFYYVPMIIGSIIAVVFFTKKANWAM